MYKKYLTTFIIILLIIVMLAGVSAIFKRDVYDYYGSPTDYAREKVNYSLFDAENYTGVRANFTENVTASWFLGYINWSNIINKFITAVDNIYIYMVGTTVTFNETKLNDTGDLRYVNIDGDTMTGSLTSEGNITAGWFNGLFNWTTDTWSSFNGYNLTFNESKLSSTYINPTQSEIIAGTIDGGSLTDVQHSDGAYDGITFNFSEEVGSPGLDLRMNFTGVNSFNRGVMRYKTSNLFGDYPIVQMWNYDTSSWEDYPLMGESDSFATMTQPVFDSSDHVQDNVAQMRIYKSSNGNTQNHYYVDWVAIVSGYGVPSGQEIDPYSFHRFENLNNTDYNITASYFFGNGSQLTGITAEAEETDPYWTGNQSSVAGIGDCSSGQFVQNTTTGGVECAAPAGSGDITGVLTNLDNYLYNGSASGDVYLRFNGTKLNETIGIYNDSMKTYVDALDTATNTSMKVYVDARDIATNATMKAYVDLLNASGLIIDWNESGYIIDWNATGLIANHSIPSFAYAVDVNTTMKAYVDLLNATGLIIDWNNSGFIINWNATGLIANFSIPSFAYTVEVNATMKAYVDTLDTATNTTIANWIDALFPRISELVGLIGNWSADITDYYTKTEVTANITSANATMKAYVDTLDTATNSSMKAYVDLLNASGLIIDWNNSGFIINWNESNYIINWNESGFIINHSILSFAYADTKTDTWAGNFTDYYTKTEVTTNISSANTTAINWVDVLFPRISELIGLLGNWSADKSDYWNTSTDLDNVIATDEITELKIDFNTACAAGSHLYVDGNNLACETDDDTTYTAGDALTLDGTEFDFDGGASPGGDLGGTWGTPSVDDDSHDHVYSNIDAFTEENLYTILSDVALFLESLVDDTSPQLGGYLDTNTQNIGSTSDEIENVYVATNSRIYFGDGQEVSMYYNGTVLIIG